jgi:hypothetical protein
MRQLMQRHRCLSVKCIWTRTNLVSSLTGFNSPGEYKRFCDYIEKQVLSGCAIERVADPGYERACFPVAAGSRIATRKRFGVPPDFPFRSLWEKVDLNAN